VRHASLCPLRSHFLRFRPCETGVFPPPETLKSACAEQIIQKANALPPLIGIYDISEQFFVSPSPASPLKGFLTSHGPFLSRRLDDGTPPLQNSSYVSRSRRTAKYSQNVEVADPSLSWYFPLAATAFSLFEDFFAKDPPPRFRARRRLHRRFLVLVFAQDEEFFLFSQRRCTRSSLILSVE